MKYLLWITDIILFATLVVIFWLVGRAIDQVDQIHKITIANEKERIEHVKKGK